MGRHLVAHPHLLSPTTVLLSASSSPSPLHSHRSFFVTASASVRMKLPASDAHLLEAQFNHLVLPPRVPSKCDDQLSDIGTAITALLIAACRFLMESAPEDGYFEWDGLRRILLNTLSLNFSDRLEKRALLQHFRSLDHDGFLILHLVEQNSGLIIRSVDSDHGHEVILEAFEASPRSKDVLATEAALEWDFPGGAVAVPYSTFSNDDFRDSLAGFLYQCSTESIKRFAAHAGKAGSSVVETRDTADPTMISSLLLTILEAHGRRLSTSLLRKRVRDNVCWADGSEMPWRRIPFWLVLRVGLARRVALKQGGELGRLRYKFLLCVAFAQLLQDSLSSLDPHKITTLKAKLARRLAKLEVARTRASPDIRPQYDSAFDLLSPMFQESLQQANTHVNTSWESLKASIKRPVISFPCFANEKHLTLSLPKSQPILRNILKNTAAVDEGYIRPETLDMSAANQRMRPLAKLCFSLTEFEMQVERGTAIDGVSLKQICNQASRKIDECLNLISTTYNGNSEQNSLMILTVMDLWLSLDQAATTLFGLLLAFSPGIPPETLDVLQLPLFSDMQRLQKIQDWLRSRQEKSRFTKRTIFDNPCSGCFAERFYDESDTVILHELHRRIERASERARADKEKELKACNERYEALQKRITETSCVHSSTEYDKDCSRCCKIETMKKMRIQTHEHFLPSDPACAKAILFELQCPHAFAAYRNVTWKILGVLAHPQLEPRTDPRFLIQDYQPLTQYAARQARGITLASMTKAFDGTHFRKLFLPADVDSVCLSNTLRLQYYDSSTRTWPALDAANPTFAHHCPVKLPPKSPFSSLLSQPQFAPDANGPSSNEIIASQPRCPPGLNMYEFMAFQSLFSGKNQRWPLILVELASSNLNFSTEAISSVISQLSSQVGPSCEGDPLRTIHQTFRDASFCSKLLDQIRLRMEIVAVNWRETNSMNMLITLLLRLVNLGCQESADDAFALLDQARQITRAWFVQLRAEKYRAFDSESSSRCSRYALWAALLCRRTFSYYGEGHCQRLDGRLSSKDLQCFVESSIALQDNMVTDPASLPTALRQTLVRDLKMTHRLRNFIRHSIRKEPEGLIAAIRSVWPTVPESSLKASSELHFLGRPYEWMAQFKIAGDSHSREQMVHYDMLEGHLLIDNMPLGRLPTEHRDSPVLSELFGQQNLLIYPSEIRGMSYKLSFSENNHQIHIGFRHGKLIVRARNFDRALGERVLEHIPRDSFINNGAYDLPAVLVDDCIHWLDVKNHYLEIRPLAERWARKQSHWCIDLRTNSASRRKNRLLDPHSSLSRRLAEAFKFFEHPQHLMVYQPHRFPICIELRRLELTFHVGRHSRLFCRELGAEVDPDQDAGTWYGLNSKLILRDPANFQSRTILVPLGSLEYSRNQFHVSIKVYPSGYYGRFTINTVLGRLDCAAEPRLLYFKAQLHAYTSAVVPDPLTSRTGAEEALHLLRSGVCQPWAPLTKAPTACLVAIADLTPTRMYYPKGLRQMQTIRWNPKLPTLVQRDEYLPLVSSILQISHDLVAFVDSNAKTHPLRKLDQHLLRRSINSRRLYERTYDESEASARTSDVVYMSRDRHSTTRQRKNVFSSVKLLARWSPQFPTTSELGVLLQQWPVIQGRGQQFNKVLLSDYLDLDFALHWGSMVDYCRKATPGQLYSLSFMFGALSFGLTVDMDVIHTLISYTISQQLKDLEPPKWRSYSHFRPDHVPTQASIAQILKPFSTPYAGDHRSAMTGVRLSSKTWRKMEYLKREHEAKAEEGCNSFAELLLKQWPCSTPSFDGLFRGSPLLEVAKAVEIVKPEWLRLYQNFELSRYISQVQQILNHYSAPVILAELELPSDGDQLFVHHHRGSEIPSLSGELLRRSFHTSPKRQLDPSSASFRPATGRLGSPLIVDANKANMLNGQKSAQQAGKSCPVAEEVVELEHIVMPLSRSKSTVKQQYAWDLKQSIDSLKLLSNDAPRPVSKHLQSQIDSAACDARQKVQDQLSSILQSLESDDARSQWLKAGGLWPCTSTVALLEQIRSTSDMVFGSGMKESLVEFAVSITHLQRVLRLQNASLKKDAKGLDEEEAYRGHSNWQPFANTDWLLLEIESNMLTRPGQIDVALATIAPSSGGNSVLQMNMGQGKTSCIIPMVAAALADKGILVRVVVPNALLLQTAQLLHGRLGGLLGRQIRHIPFSRKTPTTQETTRAYWNIHNSMLKNAGVIVALPEHIMSFMLSGIQRLSDSRVPEATPMDVEDALVARVVEDILRGNTSILPCQECSVEERQTIKKYLTSSVVDKKTLERVQCMFTDTPVARQSLHHLRGLLVHRILLLTFKKRWSVQYGLHAARDPIAVPYHAKGVPSEQAEWGHPDVAILFTCLSFYYQGLAPVQLRRCLEYVIKSDDPASEYDRWMNSGPNIPSSLKEWNVINVDDESQLHELWYHLRYSIVVINHYLNHFVFPVHAKQFKTKLQSSGWDIPLSGSTEPTGHTPLTTGFSGTNDNRTLLPLTIKQQDLPDLSRTNAEVITYLLQQRNRRYIHSADDQGKRISETDFLKSLEKLKIRVLIDAGAQVLEMDNFTLAKTWLSIDTHARAALFFKENRPFILYRKGAQVPLIASPFADDLTGCLVYLDEAHTRGTDLKMPSTATGALTLGLGQTKDHTVQAAMRLRQLATTQSVVFFATPEVHQSILDLQPSHRQGSQIDSHDVVCWLLEQTCAGLEQLQPLYYSQGMDFCRRSQALIDNPDILTNADQRAVCLKALRQVEHQTLEQMYMPKFKAKIADASESFPSDLKAFVKDLDKRRRGFQDDGRAVHGSALQEVEQEREVAHEVESVREIQKPVYYSPMKFPGLRKDIASFALTGRLIAGSFDYDHMFVCLRGTALGLKHKINDGIIKSRLFVSKEFLRTVALAKPNDNFLRHINWVLWSTAADAAIVVVPEEAELLIPLLRAAETPITHLLTYAAPATRKMIHFNDLTYYAIPSLPSGWTAPMWLRAELGLFGGRLYFEFDEYADMMKHLGLRKATSNVDRDGDGNVGCEDDEIALPASPASTDSGLFVTGATADTEQQQRITAVGDDDRDQEEEEECEDSIAEDAAQNNGKNDVQPFTDKPLTFMREWLAARRKGQDFSHTPMGYVCQGRPLSADHPFFAKAPEEPAPPAVLGCIMNGADSGSSGADDMDDEDDDEYDDAAEDFWFDAAEDGVVEDTDEE